jgi:hypothetical protein
MPSTPQHRMGVLRDGLAAVSRAAGGVFLTGLEASVRVVQPETRERICLPNGRGWSASVVRSGTVTGTGVSGCRGQ